MQANHSHPNLKQPPKPTTTMLPFPNQLKQAFTLVRRVISFGLLVFSIVVITVTIFDRQTRLSQELGPPFAFCAMWIAMVWLARVEGGQACMVGLPPVDSTLFAKTHPISYQVCQYGHRGDNLDRYLMGRQFMVLALVFIINMAATPVDDARERRTTIGQIFVEYGIAQVLVTAMIGQLFTQVTASYCMIDYINSHFMTATLYVCMAIEASGLLHVSYLFQYGVAFLAGRTIDSNEPPRNARQQVFFWGRVAFSCAVLTLSFIVTLSALFERKTSAWDGLPTTLALILFGVLMAVVGMFEGMQIAFFAVTKYSEEERKANRWAGWCCDLLFGDEGKGLAGFMIGRQLCVAACFFGIARITTISVDDGQENVLGVNSGVQAFFETGLLGAIITTIVASIAWQLVASAFPITFLGNPVTFVMLHVALAVEKTGICSFAWVLSELQQQFMDWHEDEDYIGTPEERAAKGKPDTYKKGTMGGGGAALVGNMVPTRQKTYEGSDLDELSEEDMQEHIAALEQQMMKARSTKEKEQLEREITVMRNAIREHRHQMYKEVVKERQTKFLEEDESDEQDPESAV